MVEQNGIYRCDICGNVVSVLEAKNPPIICCGKEMTKLEEKTSDEGKEKHVPIIEKFEKGIRVKVGSIPHPMEDKHYIELIQLIKDDDVIIGRRLKPGDRPEAEFCCLAATEEVRARILCNIHGLWRSG